MKEELIISELITFFVVSIIILTILSIIFAIFCKKFKFNSKNVELYGLLLNLNNTSLISMATLTINYLFLVWCTISFKGLDVIDISIILILVLISDAIIDNFKGLIKSIPLALINCGAIQVIYLLYEYVTTEEHFSYLLIITLSLVILFVFLYHTYNFFRGINNIVVKNKYLKNKKYNI